jgi:hypothetical protein
MVVTKPIQLEALLFFAIGAAVGLVALQTHNATPVTITSKAAEPTLAPTAAPSDPTTSSQISSDGKKKVIMHVTENKDGTKTYDITTSDHEGVIYAKLLPQGENLSLPFNAWTANNSYFFIQENTKTGTNILVFRANGEPFADGELFIDVTALFANSPNHNSSDIFDQATGWAENNLLIINTKREDGTQGASYWFEVPQKYVLRLATQF